MKFKKFEDFTNGEIDPNDWPTTPKIDTDKKFTKKNLKEAALAFCKNENEVNEFFEDWYSEKFEGRLKGNFDGPTNL